MALALIALTFFALHLPYLPQSLEDVDSINFALGLRQFDVAHHQPHPPGYPLFILVGKAARAVVPSETTALAAVSIVSAAFGVLAIAALFRRLSGKEAVDGTLIGTLFAATTPLYWFTAARPLSDSLGLAAAIAIQALIAGAETNRAMVVAAFLAGLGAGIRSQVLWLTVPLLLLRVLDGKTPGTSAPSPQPPVPTIAAALFLGIVLWFVPLVALSHGPAAYWHALADQGAEDLSGIQMLWTTPTVRTLIDALYYALVAPWAVWPFAAIVLVLAAAGGIVLLRENRRALLLLAAGFGPYLIFDILFQETFTVRYALPMAVPVAFLAAAAVRALPQPMAAAVALSVAMYGAHLGGRSIAAYSGQPAPVFRMLADMREATLHGPAPVLAPDRRLSFDLRRPLKWLGDGAPVFERQLASPPQKEWREAVTYWTGGGHAPVWFVVDPRRAAIDLVQHGPPAAYRYALPYPNLMSGTRPNEADWYRVDSPEWFAGDGWSLTPEAAGVSQEMAGRADLTRRAWIRTDAARAFVLGGRNFGAATTLSGSVGNTTSVNQDIPPGPFLIVRRLPTEMPATDRAYLDVAIRAGASAGPGINVALEQFDASGSRAVLGFGNGWHERELNASTGQMWRWLSARGEVHYLTNGGAATLRIAGETPLRYYPRGSRLVVRAGDRILSDSTVIDDFTIDVEVPAATEPATLTIETDQTHVPAERSWRGSADRRMLGLRIYACAFVPATVSARGTAANFPPAR